MNGFESTKDAEQGMNELLQRATAEAYAAISQRIRDALELKRQVDRDYE